ncbi:hypothetical protein ACF07S_02140 [Streptomyces sp. NPDC016640]|uniref:hypothetical protein n=1 Tax=Streptomyces sp. NPDC016640 TaxID=3364969 RepID=UPI0036FCAEA6
MSRDVRRAREFEAYVAGAGGRLLRRGTLVRRAMWLLLPVVAVALVVWTPTARPRGEPPSRTAPPLTVR